MAEESEERAIPYKTKRDSLGGDWNPGWGHIPSDTDLCYTSRLKSQIGNWIKLKILVYKDQHESRTITQTKVLPEVQIRMYRIKDPEIW